MDEVEADGMIDNMASDDTSLLKVLVDAVEKCIQSGEKRQYKDAMKLLGIDTSNEKREERKLMKRMATAHHKYYSGAAEKAAPSGDSYTFEYDEDKKQRSQSTRAWNRSPQTELAMAGESGREKKLLSTS
jgi:hypothetical protein